MAVIVNNILVGEGTLYLAPNSAATVVDVGATQEGAEISWEPDMVDIEVDQLGDAAKVVQSRVKCMVKTTLAEATLANLAYAWGYRTGLIASDMAVIANQPGVSGTTFNLGVTSTYPAERKMKLEGNAPGSNSTTTKKRTYTCNRVISYNASSHSLRRSENVAFPVEFRILPDTTATGKEYGTIIDEP